METELPSTESPPGESYTRVKAWAWSQRAKLSVIAVLIVLLWLPFWGNRYPPLVDLPEHLLVSKLLWETLAGTSGLDLRLTTFLGYKLFPYLSLAFIGVLKLFGISLIYLPKVISAELIALFGFVVAGIGFGELKDRGWRSGATAFCFILPAAVSMYVACWFIGFVNFTLGITFLIPAIYYSDKFVSAVRVRYAIATFLCLALAYMAHPFVPSFWLIWCFGRGLASVALWKLPREWIRLLLLGVIFAPIALYHLVATAGSPLAPATDIMSRESPFLPFSEWTKNRFWPLINGMYLKADDAADGTVFAIFALIFVGSAIFVAFWFKREDSSRALVLTASIAAIIASVINEKFIPVPAGHWLAYDYRFASTTYAICVVSASIVLLRHLPLILATRWFGRATFALALGAVLASCAHLYGVRAAYSRFDVSARAFMEKVLNDEPPAGTPLPHSRWHPDGTLIALYICMVRDDCNPPGTTFYHGFSGELYPVKYGSRRPQDTPAAQKSDDKSGGAPGMLRNPRGIAVDGRGNYYVADTGNARIQVFSPGGEYKSRFGEGQLQEPNGIAVAANGDVFVTDARANRLLKFDRTGKSVKDWAGPDPGFYGPRDLAVRGQVVFILDQGRSRIVRFDTATEQFSEWGSAGEEDGQFREATGIAVGRDQVFVADNGNGRVQVFDLEGKFVRQWAVPEWERYVWHYPDLVYDEVRKLLYVTSGTSKEVLTFDLAGNRVGDLPAVHKQALDNPSSLVITVVDKGSQLLVLNTGNSTVVRVPL